MKNARTFQRSILIGSALSLLATQPALAFSFLDRQYGTPELGLSARARAMGGAGVAVGQGVFSLVDNPGALAVGGGNQVAITTWLGRVSENRFVPIFDTFDSYVDENAIAVNDNSYGGMEGGVVLDLGNGAPGFVLAGGMFNRYDPRYDYFDEIRSTATTDDLLARQYITTEGILQAVTVGAAYRAASGCGVGLALNLYTGTLEGRNALVATEDGVAEGFETGESRLKRKLDGTSVSLGGVMQVSERIRVGAALETAPDLDDDYTRWTDGAVDTTSLSSGPVDLPLRFQAGLTYRPRNTFRTTFAADVVYMPWGEADDHLAPDQELKDTWEARFGLEHVFHNDFAGRLGFRYGDSYAMDEAARAVFTFGFGYAREALRVDLAGEVGKRNSRQEPLRDRRSFGSRVGLGTDRVEDTLARVFLGASYSF